jgi:hypothetical protein
LSTISTLADELGIDRSRFPLELLRLTWKVSSPSASESSVIGP